jgi:hypothetical protein
MSDLFFKIGLEQEIKAEQEKKKIKRIKADRCRRN